MQDRYHKAVRRQKVPAFSSFACVCLVEISNQLNCDQ